MTATNHEPSVQLNMNNLCRKIRKRDLYKCITLLSFIYLITLVYTYIYLDYRYNNFQRIKELLVPKNPSNLPILFSAISKLPKQKLSSENSDLDMRYFVSRFSSGQDKSHNKSEAVLIAAVLLLRIYETDKAKLTQLELKQWTEYMLYAGVGRVYLYDNYKYKNESLREWCRENFPNSVVYHDWHEFTPYTIIGTQIAAYEHALQAYKNESTWQTAFDIDEYPFMINDTNKGFLTRFLQRKTSTQPNVSEWSLQNFLFLGKPLNAQHILKRYLRRKPQPHKDLHKPIYIAKNVEECGIHHNHLARGISMDADPAEIRMNHYWGARLQNWGDDTIEVLNMTIPDASILGLVEKLEMFRNHEYLW